MATADNLYARLGISKSSSQEEIRRAYLQAAKRLHPDTRRGPAATELFIEVQEAYELLSDPLRRSAYDVNLPEEKYSPPEVMINSLYSRPMIPMSEDPQLIYVLLDLMALPDPENVTSAPINLCLILDTSSSMRGERLDVLKSTASQLVKRFRSQDVLSIVSFNDFSSVLFPATRGPEKRKLEQEIHKLLAGGGTEIFQGLEAGLGEVLKHHSPSFVNHMILITDGRTYGDEQECLRLAEEAKRRGISITGMGIGSEWNDEFLDELTGKTGGTSLFMQNSKDIQRFLEDVFDGLHEIYAESVRLDLNLRPGVELKYTFRIQPGALPLDIDMPIQLGNIPVDQSLSVLLELVVNSVDNEGEDFVISDGKILLDVPTMTTPTSSISLILTRPTSISTDELEPPPVSIIQAMSKLTLYRMQEQARADLEAGDIEKATQRLQAMATKLLTDGEPELANTILNEVERIQHGQNISEDGDKRIKYGTRALFLPTGMEETPR